MYSYIYLNGEDNFDGNNNGGDDDSFFVVLFYSDPKKVIDPVTKWAINDNNKSFVVLDELLWETTTCTSY